MCRCSHTSAGCRSVTFPTHMTPYTKVCVRAQGYQYTSPDGFCNFHYRGQTVEGYYVEGLSVTWQHSKPHLAFVAGLSNDYNYRSATVPVLPLILVQLHLHLWEKSIYVNRGTLDHGQPSGTLMTLCGTHRGVQGGAPAVFVVVRGLVVHWAKQPVMT